MHPAALAEHAYHRAYAHPKADRESMPLWLDLVRWHLRHAILISDASAFILARPVDWSRDDHFALRVDSRPTPGHFHVTAAAGDIAALLRLADYHHVTHVSFERVATRHLHRLPISSLHRHLFTRR